MVTPRLHRDTESRIRTHKTAPPGLSPPAVPSRRTESATGRLVVLVDDVLPQPAPRGDLHALTQRPFPDGLVLVLVPDRSATPAAATRRRGPGRDSAALLDVGRELAPELLGVLRGQIDLVQVAIEPERHRLVSDTAVNVVDEFGDCFL